jgi:hypothetical protein
VSGDPLETAASVNIGSISYPTRCTEAGCKNLGRLLFSYADGGGRPISRPVLCHAHGHERIALDKAAGLKIYDDRATEQAQFIAENPVSVLESTELVNALRHW